MTGRLKCGRRRKERMQSADLKNERMRMQDDAASRWLKEHSGRKQRKDRNTQRAETIASVDHPN